MQNMFLKLGSIKGECTLTKFKDQIEIYSFSHGFSQPTSALRSSEGGATTSRAHHSEISFSKRFDKSSPPIMQALWQGTTFPEVVFTCCRVDGEETVEYLVVTMNNVVISNYNISGGGDLPGETFSLNYSKVKYEYKQQKNEGGAAGNLAAVDDLATGAKK